MRAVAENNFVETWTLMADAINGGWCARSAGIVIAATGVPLAPFNLIFVTGPLRHPERRLARAFERLESQRLPFVLRVRDDMPAIAKTAGELGLVTAGTLPLMVLPTIGELPTVAAGIEVVRVDNEDAAADHGLVAAEAFNLPAASVGPLVSQPLWSAPGFELYVAYDDGEPVATSALCVTGSTAGVYNVAVPTPRRGRGLGAALTGHAIRRGRDEYGATMATLQASDMGLPVYERMGFETVCRYSGFASA